MIVSLCNNAAFGSVGVLTKELCVCLILRSRCADILDLVQFGVDIQHSSVI